MYSKQVDPYAFNCHKEVLYFRKKINKRTDTDIILLDTN